MPCSVINIDPINHFAEFWPLTLVHKDVFKMNTNIAGCTKRGSTERSQGLCLSTANETSTFFCLCTIESTKESLVKIEAKG